MTTRIVAKLCRRKSSLRCHMICLLLLPLTLAAPATAQNLTLLVVPVDVDSQALRNDDPVTRRALTLTGQALAEHGHTVHHDDWFQTRQRLGKRFMHSANDWLREARRMRSKADAMVAVKTYEIKDHRGDGEAIRIEIHARVYALPSGRVAYETSILPRSGSSTPIDCDRDCVSQAVTPVLEIDSAKLAAELQQHLPRERFGPRNRRLSKSSTPREYQLAFNGFDRAEMNRIVPYLKIFSGYKSHERLETNKCRHVIAYLSRIRRTKLESNYRRMFRELQIRNVRLRFDTLRVEASKTDCGS